MPEVSVIVPAYNAGRYVRAAIESVLAQTRRDLEVLVVDDGSKDDTAAVVARFAPPVRLLRQVNAGVSEARNHGLRIASGRYVAFLDADDLWAPLKLDRQVTALNESPKRACYTAFLKSDENLRKLQIVRSPPTGHLVSDLLLRGNVIGTPSSILCDRRLFESTGLFDSTLSQCADWDMWVRLGTLTDFQYLDEPLVTYRQHDTNMSRNPALLERDSLRVLEKAFGLPGLPEQVRRRRRRAFGRNYMVLAGTYFVAGRSSDFARCALRSLMLDPRQVSYLLTFPIRRAARRLRTRDRAADW